MIAIGPYQLNSQVLLAPMAGISDYPMRLLCQEYGAGLTPSEMITAKTDLWQSEKSSKRVIQIKGSRIPHSIQIVGSEPEIMSEAAKQADALGADIIDINMGCPAKKVCKKLAGSALLGDEQLVENILTSVVSATQKPVTLKIRTGTDLLSKNAVRIGKIAENAGIKLLTIHGRTRACRFNGHAEYDTIAETCQSLSIPVIANGDINSLDVARKVLDYTKADGIMIGRGIQGQPWLIGELTYGLQHKAFSQPNFLEKCTIILRHLSLLHDFYGLSKGVQIARKHIGWYLDRLGQYSHHKKAFNQLTCPNSQVAFIETLAEEFDKR